MIKIFQDDSLKIMDRLIKEGVKVDAVITDPPYGTTACKWDSVIPMDEMWERLKLLRKDRTPIVLFGSEPFSSYLRMSNIKEYKYDWVWYKNQSSNFVTAKKQPLRNHELISIFYKKQCVYNYIKEPRDLTEESRKRQDYAFNTLPTKSKIYNLKGNNRKYEDKEKCYPKTIKRFNCLNNPLRIHPTQKPIKLMEYLIKTYTNEGDTVLDFTMGSGQTMLGCNNLNRNGIGIDNGFCEKEKSKYYGMTWKEVVEDRLKNEILKKEIA